MLTRYSPFLLTPLASPMCIFLCLRSGCGTHHITECIDLFLGTLCSVPLPGRFACFSRFLLGCSRCLPVMAHLSCVLGEDNQKFLDLDPISAPRNRETHYYHEAFLSGK